MKLCVAVWVGGWMYSWVGRWLNSCWRLSCIVTVFKHLSIRNVKATITDRTMRSAASHVMIAGGRWNKCNLGPDCVAEEQSLILELPQSLVALPRPSYHHGNSQPPPLPPPFPGLPTRHPCGKQAHFHVTVLTSEFQLLLWRHVTGDMLT